MINKEYRVNEIFYSLQGEGFWAGRAALFVRFSGCNLRCPFCDTDFSEYTVMTAEQIVGAMEALSGDCRFVVLTGGEPTLQVDEALVALLHQHGYYISMETNGTHPYPAAIDWVTFSPKEDYVANGKVVIDRASEMKQVFDAEHAVRDYAVAVDYRFLQPCDVGDAERNRIITAACVEYIKQHPQWQLSLQQHKILNVR